MELHRAMKFIYLHRRWLYLMLLRYKERFVFRSICHTRVGQSGVTKKELQRLQIFFPIVAEQQKIASILSKVDGLIQKTNQVIVRTHRLKKGLMVISNALANKFANNITSYRHGTYLVCLFQKVL